MATHKAIDKICCVVLALTLLTAVLFANAEYFGVQAVFAALGYETRLFQTDRVHTIDLIMEDWEEFLSNCTSEEYAPCTVVIDNEAYKNVALRAKGNTSLTQVKNSGSSRYSFKLEFDHYDTAGSYYGLDKLCLNNIIQDNTYMKDYLCYRLMAEFGVDAPLCSFVYITVNGEDWGLYLAVEGIEEAFLRRHYGSDYGELYKPDSQKMGGGRGNGENFRMEDWQEDGQQPDETSMPSGMEMPEGGQLEKPDENNAAGGLDNMQPPDEKGDGREGGMENAFFGAADVLLQYTDDAYESYANIFDNAKTEITDEDKERLIASLKALNAGENLETAVDVEKVLRYFVVHNFVCNFDSYTGGMIHNYYLYEQDGQLFMLPWDYNLAFGGFGGGQDATTLVNYPIDTPVSENTVEERPMLAWIFADETYTEQYHQYFSEFMEKYFKNGTFFEMLEEARALITPYVEKDPTKFCTNEEFEAGVEALWEFCTLRAESIQEQLAGTIASKKEGQEKDPEEKIDAGNLQILAMGSMGNMGAAAGEEKPAFQGEDMPELPDSMGDGEKPPQMPDGAKDGQRSPKAPLGRPQMETPAPAE